MAYLAASDITVTLPLANIYYPSGAPVQSFPTVAYGNGALQYPAGGIPMPAIEKFGMKKEITRVFIEQPANGFIYHFDRTNRKLRIFLGAAQAAVTVANHVGVAPTGNVAAPANHVNIAVPAPANHSHDLIVASNANYGAPVDMMGVNVANQALTTNTANVGTIVGGNATKGGVQDGVVPAPANIANQTHNAPAFTGDATANLVHTVTGGGAVGEAALAEMDDGVAPAATTLYMQVIGQ